MLKGQSAADMGDRRVSRLIADSLVWDNHACMPLRPADTSFLPQLARCREAGFDVVGLNVGFGPQPLQDHLKMLASVRRWLAVHEDRFTVVQSTGDIGLARQQGKLAVFFDVEGTEFLNEGNHGIVQLLYDLGVRWMLLAYNRPSAAGGGCYGVDPGLSEHGRALLAEMKRVGMIVCCSHTGHRTASEIMAAADNPVIFSHSNANAIHTHPRNIPDELIKQCAATGGVVGVNGIGPFLGDQSNGPGAVVRHLDHIVQLVGPDHAGIGLDFVFDQQELVDYIRSMKDTFPDDETYEMPPRLVEPEALGSIISGLLALGYGDAEVKKILGGNWLRVAEQVWR